MAEAGTELPAPNFITLGPEGSDHEQVTKWYLGRQGLLDVAGVDLVPDMVDDGLERVRNEPNSFLVQCSAHQQVNVINMSYPGEVVMVDTFMQPTMKIGLLVRRDVEEPRRLAIMPATAAYVDIDDWEEVVEVGSKPIAARMLLEGEADAGIASVTHADENPDALKVAEAFGAVMTSWNVFGQRPRPEGIPLGEPLTGFYAPGLKS
ncbi:MAG TPA: hypothetical protein VFX84_00930 [Candidatus Saccharimonadales bacterium]|nr:hypothetical protein [Candidatus Saccharimonadales bacterium]